MRLFDLSAVWFIPRAIPRSKRRRSASNTDRPCSASPSRTEPASRPFDIVPPPRKILHSGYRPRPARRHPGTGFVFIIGADTLPRTACTTSPRPAASSASSRSPALASPDPDAIRPPRPEKLLADVPPAIPSRSPPATSAPNRRRTAGSPCPPVRHPIHSGAQPIPMKKRNPPPAARKPAARPRPLRPRRQKRSGKHRRKIRPARKPADPQRELVEKSPHSRMPRRRKYRGPARDRRVQHHRLHAILCRPTSPARAGRRSRPAARLHEPPACHRRAGSAQSEGSSSTMWTSSSISSRRRCAPTTPSNSSGKTPRSPDPCPLPSGPRSSDLSPPWNP